MARQANGGALLSRMALAEGIGGLRLRRILDVLGGVAVARLAHAPVGIVFRAVRGEGDRSPLRFVAVRANRREGPCRGQRRLRESGGAWKRRENGGKPECRNGVHKPHDHPPMLVCERRSAYRRRPYGLATHPKTTL